MISREEAMQPEELASEVSEREKRSSKNLCQVGVLAKNDVGSCQYAERTWDVYQAM